MSRSFVKAHPGLSITIRVPSRIAYLAIKEVRLNPLHHARYLEAEFVYKTKGENLSPKQMPGVLAIDLGVDTLAASISTNGTAFLIDGKRLKAENQWYNKERARLQAVKSAKKYETRKMAAIAYNRENLMRDYMSKSGHLILHYCLDNKIGKVVVGVNPGWKQQINIGRTNNQNFVQIPFWKFRRFLKHLCEQNGIAYAEITESYTSKASFLDRDILPEFNAESIEGFMFSGKRIKRGLYRSSNGRTVNADLNAAANILRKAVPDADLSAIDRALCLNPVRFYPLATQKKRLLKSKAAA